MIALSGQGQPAIKLAAEWHRMPHRRFTLRDVAPWLMLQDAGTQTYLSARRLEWSKRLEDAGENRDVLELFLARFAHENYVQTPQPDGQVLIEIRVPSHLEGKTKRAQEEGDLKMLSLTLASRARQYLAGQDTLLAEQVPVFAAQTQRLANWQAPPEDKPQAQYRRDSIAGGVAVLVVQHRVWLAQNPDLEKWCMDTLRT
jgi:hypothetical protein